MVHGLQPIPSQHVFRSIRRQAAKEKQNAFILALQSELAAVKQELFAWQFWWHGRGGEMVTEECTAVPHAQPVDPWDAPGADPWAAAVKQGPRMMQAPAPEIMEANAERQVPVPKVHQVQTVEKTAEVPQLQTAEEVVPVPHDQTKAPKVQEMERQVPVPQVPQAQTVDPGDQQEDAHLTAKSVELGDFRSLPRAAWASIHSMFAVTDNYHMAGTHGDKEFSCHQVQYIINTVVNSFAERVQLPSTIFAGVSTTMNNCLIALGDPDLPRFSRAEAEDIISLATSRCADVCDGKKAKCPKCQRCFTNVKMFEMHMSWHEDNEQSGH